MLGEVKILKVGSLFKVILILFELCLIYYLNKGQHRLNIYYFGADGAYLYHFFRAFFFIIPVACIYVLCGAFWNDSKNIINKLNNEKKISIMVFFINIIAISITIYMVYSIDIYNSERISANLSPVILVRLIELISLLTLPFLFFTFAEWVELFRENLSRPIKILLLLTFLYVGYVDRVISNFIGLRLISPTVSLAQFFYRFTGGEIRIASYDDGLPIITDNKFSGIINPGCAGYEGMSFIALFLILFMPYLRSVFNLIELILICLVCMSSVFLMNAFRLALLVYIGEHISTGVAVGGFHTNFGVLTLIMVSTICMGLAWVKTRLYTRGAVEPPNTLFITEQKINSSHFFPLIMLLTASLFTGLFSEGFNWLYPVPITMAVLSLLPLRKKIRIFVCPSVHFPLIVGLAVFIIWIVLIPRNLNYEANFDKNLNSHGQLVAILWIIFRVFGSSIVVPIVEELAFRGAIWDFIVASLKFKITDGIKNIFALVITSVAFGFLHDDITVAVVAGMFYGFLRFLNNGASAPIIAHIITNTLISLYVLVFKAWSYW